MGRRAAKRLGAVCLVLLAGLGREGTARAVNLDKDGEIRLGARLYSAVRIGTEDTTINITTEPTSGRQTHRNVTFPVSSSGHVRQNRFFLETELDHDLLRLVRERVGPLLLIDRLPFRLRRFKYHMVFRGEYEGIYDYGPSEYSTSEQYRMTQLATCFAGRCPGDPGPNDEPSIASRDRKRLRDNAVFRARLFQAYLETQVGDLLMRVGRQILVWGETDNFRLLDNINPIDNSFGGFLIPLDERRVPLDMAIANYYFGHLGPLHEAFLEAYLVIDNEVAYRPGIPKGSAWALPNLGEPSATQFDTRNGPSTNFKDARGGFQFKFNAPVPAVDDVTFGVAHYYTYVDTPQVQSYVSQQFPVAITSGPATGFQAWSVQRAPLVQVTGATSTFAVPATFARNFGLSGEPIVRTELAYFSGEPRHTQQQLDPFTYARGGCRGKIQNGLCTGGRDEGDSWNFVLGLDTNQWIRFLNPYQTFFFTTQFFYKHLRGAANRQVARDPDSGRLLNYELGEVLPVPAYRQSAPDIPSNAAQPVLVHNATDQFLQTLAIFTAYYSGRVNPSFTLFYDWSGAVVLIPQVTLLRDPFRLTMSYSFLHADTLKGSSGVSLLRDRDNVLFQLEYVF
jgi:hypothetical protein